MELYLRKINEVRKRAVAKKLLLFFILDFECFFFVTIKKPNQKCIILTRVSIVTGRTILNNRIQNSHEDCIFGLATKR